jgi:hypothetical protein
MTRDASAQAVHERLEHLVSAMPEPDVEAGWAALVAQLEPPVAPVVPLRRRSRPWRGVVLGVAAATVIAGAAFAAVYHGGGDEGPATVGPSATTPGHLGGPHVHPALSGPAPGEHATPSVSGGGHPDSTSHQGGSAPSGSRPGGTPSASTHRETQPSHHDSPDDTDHGTGNDGTHDDNGLGNNTQGQDPGSGNGNGNGSSGGSGNEGSGSGHGSADRGTHGSGGGDHPMGGGSDGDQGSAGQGQGGGPGPNA